MVTHQRANWSVSFVNLHHNHAQPFTKFVFVCDCIREGRFRYESRRGRKQHVNDKGRNGGLHAPRVSAQPPAFASSMCAIPECRVCCHVYEPRCLATFGLTRTRIMDDDTDISGDKWDVYSLAVVVSFLFSEHHPYSGLSDA